MVTIKKPKFLFKIGQRAQGVLPLEEGRAITIAGVSDKYSFVKRVESFNATLLRECLNRHWFESLRDAYERIEAWRGSIK